MVEISRETEAILTNVVTCMVECPRCGSNINAIKQECFKCGYLHDWDDFVDYDLIEVNSFDKILEYNSYEIIDVVRERNQLIPKVSNQIRFCPECGSFIVQKEQYISCLVCGYDGYFVMDSASLWQDIIEVMCDCPLDR